MLLSVSKVFGASRILGCRPLALCRRGTRHCLLLRLPSRFLWWGHQVFTRRWHCWFWRRLRLGRWLQWLRNCCLLGRRPLRLRIVDLLEKCWTRNIPRMHCDPSAIRLDLHAHQSTLHQQRRSTLDADITRLYAPYGLTGNLHRLTHDNIAEFLTSQRPPSSTRTALGGGLRCGCRA